MLSLKWIFLGSFCLAAVQAWADPSAQVTACLEQGKKEYSAQEYTQAQKTFERCFKLDPKQVDTLLSLGGVYMTLDELDKAKMYFLAALKQMPRTSAYQSYTYSMLGDIALKQQAHKEALGYYNQSLRFNEANVNSLVGKGVIIEHQGNQKEAAEIYKTALAVEPLNLIARKRLIALEPIYFTDEDLLEALKQRYAVLTDKKKISDSDRDLFNKIHAAEQRGGIDYLKGKYNPVPEDYIVTLFKDTGFAREVLTLSGYQAMQKQIGQDAVAVFQKAGVPAKDVFDLRDLKGNKIFLADSTLTHSGLYVYNEALKGKRMFLLPTEELPPTKEHLTQISDRIKELGEKGYTEISAAEVEQLKRQTNCTEKTMRRDLGLYIVQVNKTNKRYFVFSNETKQPKRGALWYYIAGNRSRKNPAIVVPRNSLTESYALWNYKLCSAVDGELIE